jgi:hypothetical protein
MAGWVGKPSGLPVAFGTGLSTLSSSATRLTAGAGYRYQKEAIMASTSSLASSCATLRASINEPGFAEAKFLKQHFAAMSRPDQLTILALVHSRAMAEYSRRNKEAGRANRVIVTRQEAK